MADQPVSINLALIVARVTSHPRGWRVDSLKRELNIADRTYRKYRKILTEEFPPFQRRDGTSCLAEVADGEFKYLRIVSAADSDSQTSVFSTHVGAICLARSALYGVSSGGIKVAIDGMVNDLISEVRERHFAHNTILRNIERVFPSTAVGALDGTLDRLVHAALYHRRVIVRTSVAEHLLHDPTIWWRRGELYISDTQLELKVSHCLSVDVV